ncbi:MAG: Eco57I restriction-modification methylase domain-containing protein [Promethearchaeota archaeon]
MVIKNISSKKDDGIGQIFTPNYIAEFMVKNVIRFIGNSKDEPHTLRILEPSVGEGIFLKFLQRNNFSNITAYEMDNSLKENLLNSYPNIKFKFENFLGADTNKKFDIIIGNPPYLGQNYNAEIFQEYVKNYSLCARYFVGNMDLFYFFIHLGIEKLNPGGFLSYITTNYWITKSKKTGIKLLKPHVLEECFLLQYIDLSQLTIFEGAKGQMNCIFVLQKKTEDEKIQKKNKNIEIVQIFGNKETNINYKALNEKIFNELIYEKDSSNIKKYISALSNNDLKKDKNWSLTYPKEVKTIVAKIEEFCKFEGKTSLLKDYFLIRNGLILIKDSIFILKEGNDLKIYDNDLYIKINGEFVKLTEKEKMKLKKLYKSKSIKTYGYNHKEFAGYVIYFNKNQFKSKSIYERNQLFRKQYPSLSKYLHQYEKELRETLINANENPEDFYFPRRGSFIRNFEGKNKGKLSNLEPLYDNGEKIFIKFISKDNIFGYSNSSYYATSDTYFLWPRVSEENIDCLLILAYLNSKIVRFLFKAKNISIKRSKTKLEYNLPIPNFNSFNSQEDISILKLIKILTSYLTKQIVVKVDDILKQLQKMNFHFFLNKENFKIDLQTALKNDNKVKIQSIIDDLFFQLFCLNKNEIEALIEKYYRL